MAHPKLQMLEKKAPALSAERFFGEILPRVFAGRRELLAQLGGTYGFKVHGAGEWVLDFGAGSVDVGDADGAELVVETWAPELTRWLNGTLDIQRAHAEGRFDMRGQSALFPKLTAALRPA